MSRVYNLYAKKAKGNNDLITDTCYLNNSPLFALFHCGASHSFILTKCVQQFRLKVISLSFAMVVTLVTGNTVET